jgi:AcrR family transcriptional regulator
VGLTARRLGQRELLLEAAYELVADVGIDGLRTRDICKQADLNLAVFHYCFASKDDFLTSLYQYIVERFRIATERFLADAHEPSEQLEALIRLRAHLTHHMARDLKVWRVFQNLSETNLVVREILKSHFGIQRERIAEVVNRGIREGQFRALPSRDPDVVAAMIVSLQNGLIMQLGIDAEAFDADVYAESVVLWITGGHESSSARYNQLS